MKYKVGDKVVVIANSCGYGHKNGQVLEITSAEGASYGMEGTYMCFTEYDVKLFISEVFNSYEIY